MAKKKKNKGQIKKNKDQEQISSDEPTSNVSQQQPIPDEEPISSEDLDEIFDTLKETHKVQEGSKRLQEELEQIEVQGESEDELIKVIVSGNQTPKRVEISSEVMNQGAEILEGLLTAAAKDAYSKSKQVMVEHMEKLSINLKEKQQILGFE